MRVRHGCLVGTLLASFLTAAPASALPIEPLGPQLRLTQVGTGHSEATGAVSPGIAYNSARDEYLLVWKNERPSDHHVWAQRLRADGSPIGEAFEVSGRFGVATSASDPAVAYDPERDRYGVAFMQATDDGREVFVQRISGDGRLIWPNGDEGGPPTQASHTSGGNASSPGIVYRPDANGDNVPGDRWIVSYSSSAGHEVYLSAVGASSSGVFADRRVSDTPAAGAAWAPNLAVVPGSDDLLVAWQARVSTGGDSEIWVNRVRGDLPSPDTGQAQITVTGGAADSAHEPSVAADTDTNRFLIAYAARETGADGYEIHVQRIDAALNQLGIDDQQISSAGPAGSGVAYHASTPTAGYHPSLRRYLVTWVGDDEPRPRFDREVTGTVLDAEAVEAEPQEFAISHMRDHVSASHPAMAAAPAAKGWLTVWAGVDTPARLTGARLVRRFRVRDTHTRVRRLAVVGAKPGMRIELRCRGRGCPRARKLDVTRAGTVNLKRYVRRARLRPRAVLVVRILEPGAIGRMERFRIRDDRAPLRRPSAIR